MCFLCKGAELSVLRSIAARSSVLDRSYGSCLRMFGALDPSTNQQRCIEALDATALTQRCCAYVPGSADRSSHQLQQRRFCTGDSGKDKKSDLLDGLATRVTHKDIEEKFGESPKEEILKDLHPTQPMDELLDSDSESLDVSESGFTLDYLSATPMPEVEEVRSGEICEEGFWMEYTAPMPKRAAGILDYIRRGGVQRRQHDWQHLDERHQRLVTLDDSYEELDEAPMGEDPTLNRTAYREKDQNTMREVHKSTLPPWIGRSFSTTHLVEKDNWTEVGGKGKLNNKIVDIELTVEQLRVDTRTSMLLQRKQQIEAGDTDLQSSYGALQVKVEKERELRRLCGIEYEPMMLLTVGAQGSGKSKFSMDLVEHGSLPWARINQDTIRDGRRGTKAECVDKAKYMMHRGFCVIVDRMNFSVGTQTPNPVQDHALLVCRTTR